MDTNKLAKLDKKKLIDEICKQIESDLKDLRAAARATYEAAVHEESKPENEYDTRGLEASYLAGAQAHRVAELEELLYIYRNMNLELWKKDQPIGAGALVEVEYNNRKSIVFVLPKGGGLTLQFEGKPVQVVTPTSPLGAGLLGMKVGDTASVEAGRETREYDILSVQ